MDESQQLLDLVGAFQDGVDNDEAWMTALDRLSDAFGGAALFLGSTREDGSRFELSGHRIGPERTLMINGPLASREANPVYELLSRMLRSEPGRRTTRAVLMSEALSREELINSAVYREAIAPAGYDHVLAMVLDATPTSAVSLTVVRPTGAGDFEPSHVRLAEVIAPHLVAALRLRQRLALASSSELLLESIAHPVLIVDADCALLQSNALARTLMRGGEGLFEAHGRLRAGSPAETRKLEALIAEAARAARGVSLVPPAVLVVGREDKAALVVRILPLAPRDRSEMPGSPVCVALMVHDPERVGRPTSELLVDGLGLSPAEALVASRMWQGDSVAEAADALGLSPNTVKSHLKTIYERLDVNRQADLIRRIAMLLAEVGGAERD